jgi:hypothetical protein
MKLFVYAIFFSLAGCIPYVPVGTYRMKDLPKTALSLKYNQQFQFVLDYQDPYVTSHDHPEQYFFMTTGTWQQKGRNIILTSTHDSLDYKLYNVKVYKARFKDSDYYEFHDIFNELLPILYVKHSGGRIEYLNNAFDYCGTGNEPDTLQFYFFGYRPVSIIHTGELGYQFATVVFPEYRPGWINNMKLRIKVYHNNRKRITTLNWNYLKKQLQGETDKKYMGPPKF